MTNLPTKTADKDSSLTEFVPYGGNDPIKLSVSIVQTLVAKKTRSGQTCSATDALNFIVMCKSRRLNPFEGDAFLIGFDTKNGPVFNLVTAHQAYLKRAELHPEFDGMESGIIVREDGTDREVNSEILPDGATLIGAWATVHFKNRKHPMTKRIPLARFRQQYERQQEWGGPWKDDPAGMACKTAEADALRSSFPTMLGGLYMADEISLPVGNGKTFEASVSSLVETTSAPERQQIEAPVRPRKMVAEPESFEEAAAPEPPKAASPQELIAQAIVKEGFTFDQFREWAIQTKNADSSLGSFDEMPTDVAKRLIKAVPLIIKALQERARQ